MFLLKSLILFLAVQIRFLYKTLISTTNCPNYIKYELYLYLFLMISYYFLSYLHLFYNHQKGIIFNINLNEHICRCEYPKVIKMCCQHTNPYFCLVSKDLNKCFMIIHVCPILFNSNVAFFMQYVNLT